MELQAQFYDLSKTFESAAHATGTGVKGKRDKSASRECNAICINRRRRPGYRN